MQYRFVLLDKDHKSAPTTFEVQCSQKEAMKMNEALRSKFAYVKVYWIPSDAAREMHWYD